MDAAALIRADAVRLPIRDGCVDLTVTSPPYYALRSYQDQGGHYDGQIGSEASPRLFLTALWAVMDELWRTLKPLGSALVNLGDKYAGSGGHNNANIAQLHASYRDTSPRDERANVAAARRRPYRNGDRTAPTTARRDAPDSYIKDAGGIRNKSRMLLPHRFALGLIDPDYRRSVEAPWLLASEVDYPQWICRMDGVWAKLNGMPESVGDRVRASHECLFHLTKSEQYYANMDLIREGYAPGTTERYAAGYNLRPLDAHRTTVNTKLGGDTYDENPLGKLPGSAWTIDDDPMWWELPSEPLAVPKWMGTDHFAAFPTEIPRRAILAWSPPGICTACGEGRRAETAVERTPRPTSGPLRGGRNRTERDGHPGVDENFMRSTTITGEQCACPTPDAPTRPAVVLDPFGGTGTTAMVARALGRFGINADLSADYLRLADWRVHRSGHWDKVIGRTTGRRSKTKVASPGQLSLLG